MEIPTTEDIELMDRILVLLIKNDYRIDECEELQIDNHYYEFLIRKIIAFSRHEREIIKIMGEYSSHESIALITITTKRFIESGGFKNYYGNIKNLHSEQTLTEHIMNNPRNVETNKPNAIIMKQSEKLDLILKELYKHKNDGKLYSIREICQNIGIPLDSDLEIGTLAHRLENDGYIKASFVRFDCLATLTTHGIDYCEENSYTYKGQSIITNNYTISLVNSPNANIVNQSQNVTITQNINDATKLIDEIREKVKNDNTIQTEKVAEILECLNEIQNGIKNNNKPKFAMKSLYDIAGHTASIASLLITLGQFACWIPPLPT